MNANSEFLSHLRSSSETVKDWPDWKTEMWTTSHKTKTTELDNNKHTPVQNLLLTQLGRTKKQK